LKKRLRERIKIEVRSAKHWRVFPEYNVLNPRETPAMDTMHADAFWKNYAMGQDWQKRHNITWWRSRCIALEHENQVLRDKMRLLAQRRDYHDIPKSDYHAEDNGDDAQAGHHADLNTNSEDLEFNVTEDMLNFFETSERHKRELREKYGPKKTVHEKNSEETPIIGGAESARMRKEEANLLYGEAGFKILAMETALQSIGDRFEDIANPQYWPNIPLKP